MTPVRAMVAASVVSWLAATFVVGTRTGLEMLFGMLGPLVATTVSWIATERTFRRDPHRVTSLMIVGFGAKVLFFGAYVTVMLAGLSLRPVPFVASFTGFFIGLYALEAVYLRRLLRGRESFSGEQRLAGDT